MRALVGVVLLGLLVGAAARFLARRLDKGVVGEEVHLLGLPDRISFEGEPGLRVHTLEVGGAERLVAPLSPPASLEVREVAVAADATLSFGVGSLDAGWSGREAFEIALLVDGSRVLERRVERKDAPSGWIEIVHDRPIPAGSHTLRFEVRAPSPVPSLVQAVLLGDPVLRSAGRTERVARKARGVVLLLADTLRADRLSFTGYARPTTPNLDRLARGAVRFRAALSPSSWTKPAVASLFTGLSPARHGATHPFSSLPPTTPVLAESMRRAGFRTAAFVDNRLISLPEFGFDRGFDAFLGVDARAGGLLDLAYSWIEANRGGPFFAYLHLFDPHEPYQAPPPHFDRFAKEVAPDGIPAAVPSELERRLRVALYDGEVAYLDDSIGRFLARLARAGLDSRTVLAFASDHGEEFWEHGGERHGHAVYEELVRVPLLLRGARGTPLPPADVLEPVTLEDVFPTLARLAEADAPANLDGEDLGRAIRRARRGEDRPAPRTLHHESEHFQRRAFAIRRGPWKYLEQARLDEGTTARELYDLATDPGETRDLAASSPAVAAELARLLDAHRGASRRGAWHLSWRAAARGTEFSGRVEAAGGIEEVRVETSGAEERPPEIGRDGDAATFRVRAEGGTAGVLVRTNEPGVPLRVVVLAAGSPLAPSEVLVGPSGLRPASIPFEARVEEAASADFLLDPAPRLEGGSAAACRVWRFDPPRVRVEDLPPEEVERLRALGYVR